MIAFYDPTTKQVRAWYTGDTNSTVWSGLGYTKVTIPEPLIDQIGLDVKLVLRGSVPTGTENWPRPVMSGDTEIAADDAEVTIITATFNGPISEDIEFSVNGGSPSTVSANGTTAQLTFGPVGVAGVYSINCASPTYGSSLIDIRTT